MILKLCHRKSECMKRSHLPETYFWELFNIRMAGAQAVFLSLCSVNWFYLDKNIPKIEGKKPKQTKTQPIQTKNTYHLQKKKSKQISKTKTPQKPKIPNKQNPTSHILFLPIFSHLFCFELSYLISYPSSGCDGFGCLRLREREQELKKKKTFKKPLLSKWIFLMIF